MKEYQDKLNEKVRMIQTPLKSSQTQNQDANTENQNSHFSKINDKLTIKSDQKLNQFISSIENKNSEQKKQKLNIYSQVLQNQKQQKLYQKISLNSNKNINSSHKKIATLQNDYQIQNYLKQAADKVKINSQNIFLKNSDYQIEKIIEKENQQIPVQIHLIDQFKLGNSYEKIKNSTKRSPISQDIKAGNNLQKEDQSEENKSSKYNIYSYKPVQTLDLKYQTSRKLVDESTPISDSKINTNKQRKSRKDRCSDRKSFNKDYVQTDYQETIQIQRDDVDNLYSQDKDSQNQRFILNEFMQIEQSLNNKEIEFQNMNMTNSLKLEKNFIIHQSRNESQQFQQQQLSQLSIMDQIQKTVPSPLKQSIKPQQITSLQSLNVLDKQEDFMSQINQNSQFSSQINKQITKDQEIEFENDTKYFAEITEFESSQNFEQKIQSDEKLFLYEIDIEVLKEEKQSIQLSEECHSEDIINPAEEARRIVDLIKTQLLIDDSNKSQTDKSFNLNSSKINNYNTVIKCISPKKELYNNQLQQKNDNQEQIIYDETNISENSQEQVIKPDQENIEFINNLYEEKRIMFENQSNKIIKLEEDQNITIKDQAYNSVNQQDSKESKEENEEFYMQEILSPFRNLRMSNVGQGLISSPSDKKDLASDKQWQINPVKVRRCPSDQIEFMDKQFQNQHFSYTMEYPTFINNFNNQQNEEINQILKGEISPGIIKSIYTNQRSEMIERLMQTQRTIEENSPTRNSNVNIEMIQRLKQKRLTQRSKSRESIINSSLAQIDL